MHGGDEGTGEPGADGGPAPLRNRTWSVVSPAVEVAALRRAADRARALALGAGEPVAVVVDGDAVLVATDPVEIVRADGAAVWDALHRIDAGGFWVGWIAYDVARAIERVDSRAAVDRPIPDVAFARFATVIAYDRHGVHVRRGHAGAARHRVAPVHTATPVAALDIGAMTSSLTRAEHSEAVVAIHELLRAGECYQVNLTRRLHSSRVVDPYALFAALVECSPAPHAALVEIGDVAVVSASPERFVRRDGRLVETAPIKGTHAQAAALRTSAKDAAEHIMIVDLARNDLGRVAQPGTVQVRTLAEIERHPGLHHMVSRVEAQLRANAGLAELVRATFPPASVTGAPKPRVLRAIEALEPVRRGVYCGAVGWVDGDARRADLAVAIRTFTITPAGTDLGVGGGIVIDSDPDGEWHETQLKAARLLRAAGGFEADDAQPADAVARRVVGVAMPSGAAR